MTQCSDKSHVRAYLRRNQRDLLVILHKEEFAPARCATLLKPYIETIVTSLQKAGYLSRRHSLSFESFLKWMLVSKEWHKIMAFAEKSESFCLDFYLLRSLQRYLAQEGSGPTEPLKNDVLSRMSDDVLGKLDLHCSKLEALEQKIITLYFDGLTEPEIAELLDLERALVSRLVSGAKSSLIEKLEKDSTHNEN
jgi:hypothetical protein